MSDYIIELVANFFALLSFESPAAAKVIGMFIFLMGELFLLFILISFLVALLQIYISKETIQKALTTPSKLLNSVLGAVLGSVTPFCSCSTIPLLVGLIKSKAPFSGMMSFLITSPILNPAIIVLFVTFFGVPATIIYAGFSFTFAVLVGYFLDKRGFDRYIKADAIKGYSPSSCCDTDKAKSPNAKTSCCDTEKPKTSCCDTAKADALQTLQPMQTLHPLQSSGHIGQGCCDSSEQKQSLQAMNTLQTMNNNTKPSCCDSEKTTVAPISSCCDQEKPVLAPISPCCDREKAVIAPVTPCCDTEKPVASSTPCCDTTKINTDGEEISYANFKGSFVKRNLIACKYALIDSVALFRKVLLYLVFGASIGAFIYGFVPEDLLSHFAGANNLFAVPVAAVLGIPMYIRTETMIPIASVLVAKGVGLGTMVALIIGGAGASIPEVSLLSSIFKKQLVFTFLLCVFVIATFTGFAFNLFL